MKLYRNITDEPIFDKITGITFQPGHDYWVRDEVQPDYLLRECKVFEEAEKVEWIKTDYFEKDPRFVAIKEMVYQELEAPPKFVESKDGKLVPNPKYDASVTHYHNSYKEELRMTEKDAEAAKEAYLALLQSEDNG